MTNLTLQEWALKNGLDANIKSMTQAEKTMLRYQYVMANVSGVLGDYQKTSLSWSNQIRQLGQNFQRLGSVIGSGFIAWLRPMIVQVNAAMDSIIAAVQKTVNALGKIFGWQMIVDTTGNQLIDDTEGVADAWDDATGAAKKYAKQLLGIDELNNLTTNDGSGSGADSGIGGGLSGGNVIEPGGISFEKFESDIDNLFDLGKTISDKLRDMLAGIDWNSIYEKAENFGKGLADFLNGLIQPETFYQVGRTIAGALNTVSNAIISFFKNADWKQYGDAFIAGFQGFFDEIEIPTLVLTIGAITIPKVSKWIFGGGALKTLGTTLSGLFKGGESATLFAGISTSSMVALSAITALVAGLGYVLATNEDIRNSYLEVSNTIQNALKPAFEFIGNTVLPDIINGFKGLIEILSPFGEFLETVFTSIWQDILIPVMEKIGTDIIPKLTSTFENLWNNALVPLGNLVKSVLSPVLKTLADILTSLWQNVIVPLADGIGSVLMAAFNSFIEIVNVTVDRIKPMIEIIQWLWDNALSPLVNNLLNQVKPVFDTVFTFMGGLVNSLLKTFSGLITFITGVFTGNWRTAWNGIKDIFKGIFNGIITIAEGAINLLIDGINSLTSGIRQSLSNVAGVVGFDINIPDIPHVVLAKYQYGGLPPQGSVFVAGETYGQSEWVGNINGKTGVVSGYEITDISKTIRETSEQEMMMMRQEISLLQGILAKEFGISQSTLGQAVQTYGQEYFDRTGRQAYQY